MRRDFIRTSHPVDVFEQFISLSEARALARLLSGTKEAPPPIYLRPFRHELWAAAIAAVDPKINEQLVALGARVCEEIAKWLDLAYEDKDLVLQAWRNDRTNLREQEDTDVLFERVAALLRAFEYLKLQRGMDSLVARWYGPTPWRLDRPEKIAEADHDR